MSARDHGGGKAPKHPVDPAAVVAANVNVSLDNEFRQHDGVLPIFRRLPNSVCSSSQSSTVAWAGFDSSHRLVPQTNTCYHIKESSFGGVTKMIRLSQRSRLSRTNTIERRWCWQGRTWPRHFQRSSCSQASAHQHHGDHHEHQSQFNPGWVVVW